MEVRAAVDTGDVAGHDAGLHLQAGHQCVRGAFLDSEQVPYVADSGGAVLFHKIQNLPLPLVRAVFRQAAAPVHQLPVHICSGKCSLPAQQEFAVGDIAALHAEDFPVPGTELLVGKEIFRGCMFLYGPSRDDILEEGNEPRLADEGEHRLLIHDKGLAPQICRPEQCHKRFKITKKSAIFAFAMHFQLQGKIDGTSRDFLRDMLLPLGGILLITGALVAVFAAMLHLGQGMAPVIPPHMDDGEMVDPNPMRLVFLCIAFCLSFFLAHLARRAGNRGAVLPAFLLGYAGGTLLWQSAGECAWHFSIRGDGYLMCLPHLEGASALMLVLMVLILLGYCYRRRAFEWGIWVFVLSFIGNWLGHFVMIGTYPLVASLMGEERWYSLAGWGIGLATVAAALLLYCFAARTRKARLCCCLLLYFGVGIIVTGAAGI